MNTAKILTKNNEQTVILPSNIHINENEMYVKKFGSSILLISKRHLWNDFISNLSLFSDDFMEN